jgi:DNA-binding response OmpR family regulator
MEGVMHVVVSGDFEPHEGEAVRAALARAEVEAVFQGGADLRRVLTDPRSAAPHAIVLDAALPQIAELVAWVRGEARLFAVPIILLVPDTDDRTLVEAFTVGADDAIPRSGFEELTRRVENLAGFDPQRLAPPSRGRLVLAHPDESRRRLLGRLMRRAGFDVAFAGSGKELITNIGGLGDVRLLVASSDLPPEGIFSIVHAARGAVGNHGLPIIVLGRENLDALEASADRLGAAVVGSELAPADNLLFLANEVTRRELTDLRNSARLLYATACSFRAAGEMTFTHGLTYNVSRDGLYVRTLDPPPRGTEVWIELRPPRVTRAVHLRATVMWALGVKAPAMPAPAGFGVRIDEAESASVDLEAYRAAYDHLQVNPRLGP